MNNKKLKYKHFLTKNNFEQLGDLNAEFFESAKLSLLDPLGLYLANDVKWIKPVSYTHLTLPTTPVV